MAHMHDSETQKPAEDDSGDSSSHPVEAPIQETSFHAQEVEKGNKDSVDIFPVADIQESEDPSESCENLGFSFEDNGEMGVSKPQEIQSIDGESKRAASGGGKDGASVGENGGDKSAKCALTIQVIDDTALIETGCRAMKEKRPKRQVRAGKSKNSMADERMVKKVGKNGNNSGKKAYSKEELMALRYEGLDGQKKRWVAAYCGLGPLVQKEYDGLLDCGARSKQLQQKKKKNKKTNSSLNVNQDSQNEASASFLGPWAANQRGYYIKPFYADEWTIGIIERHHLLHIQNIL